MLVISSELVDRILDTIAHHGSEEERAWGRSVLQSLAIQASEEDREIREAQLLLEQGMVVMRRGQWGTRVICLGEGLGDELGETVGVAIQWQTG